MLSGPRRSYFRKKMNGIPRFPAIRDPRETTESERERERESGSGGKRRGAGEFEERREGIGGWPFFFSKEISSFENTFDAEHFFFLMQIIMSGERGRGGRGRGGGRGEKGTMSGKSVVFLCLVG